MKHLALAVASLIALPAAAAPPLVDLSHDTARHVVVAQGTAEIYHAHPTTLLLPDGNTMFAAWCLGHGGACGPLKRSDDGGLTWSALLPVPENWKTVRNCPALYRLADPRGVTRLLVFAGQGPDGTMHQSVSVDDGRTWSPMQSNGLVCVMPFCTVVPVDDGRKLLGLTNIRRPGETEDPRSNVIAQSESTDGGLTWSPWRILLDLGSLRPCEPEVVRSPDGRQLLCLMRENVRTQPAHFMTSDDEGRTWSAHRPLPPALHGDRHKAVYAADGRLVIAFRDMGRDSPTRNHFVAWVGRYDDILAVRDGQYKIKLLHSHKGSDCGYPGLELLPDGTFVATTYVKYRPGHQQHSVVSSRFTLADTDQAEKSPFTGGEAPSASAGTVPRDDQPASRTAAHLTVVDGPNATATAQRGAAQPRRPFQPDPPRAAAPPQVDGRQFDLVIFGATPGGIAMAVRAARENLDVLLVNHNRHLGGILSSGLRVWDTLHEGRRSPIYDEVRQALFDHYRHTYGQDSRQYRLALPGNSGHTNGLFEPAVAEHVLTRLVNAEPRITLLPGFVVAQVERQAALVKAATFRQMHGSQTVRVTAAVFADCSYEGDLAAAARAPYRVGRESRDEFGEPHAGVVYLAGGRPSTAAERRLSEAHARLKLRKFTGWQTLLPDSTGQGDRHVQAFNYRAVLTDDPSVRLPVTRPDRYDRDFIATLESGGLVEIPNRKFGWNRPQVVGPQDDYVEGDWTVRQRVMDEHWQATLGMLYFLQNDESVPAGQREYWRRFGLAADEFTDHDHRPYEIYVREARRIVGRYVFTQHDGSLPDDLDRAPVHGDSVGVTEWYFDTHACTRRRAGGSMDEGKMMLHETTFPGQVPYRTLLPEGIDNLLVPVCLSATHVAWGTIRLEPTWMNIAESAAYAARLAVQHGVTPAEINPDGLLRLLAERRVMITFFNDLDLAADDPRVAAAQYFGTQGFFSDYSARLDQPLTQRVWAAWQQGFARLRSGQLDPMVLAREVAAADKASSPPLPQTRGDALLDLWNRLKAP